MGTNDPLIKMIMDDSIVSILSTLIAKFESMFFDEERSHVFRTSWGQNLFHQCALRLTGGEVDIDDWYRTQVRTTRRSRVRRDIDPSLCMQEMSINWLAALLDMEVQIPQNANHVWERGSLLRILHNIFEMEDSALAKLSTLCKKERQYNHAGISKMFSHEHGTRAPLLTATNVKKS